MRIPKIGDRFLLLNKEWRVVNVYDWHAQTFRAIAVEDEEVSMFWRIEEADKLNWCEIKVNFTKEQVNAINEFLKEDEGGSLQGDFIAKHKIRTWLKDRIEN